MTDIPEGYGIIAGRSRANAQAALDAAAKAGVDVSEVKAVSGGYLVPDAVLDAFHEAAGTEPEPDVPGDVYPTSDWKNAEIKSWAEANNVDLGDATTKADMLAAIAATNKEE
jgi:hypothetical protein